MLRRALVLDLSTAFGELIDDPNLAEKIKNRRMKSGVRKRRITRRLGTEFYRTKLNLCMILGLLLFKIEWQKY